jgi:uncharacterized repeat protein (TIGR01451 family)
MRSDWFVGAACALLMGGTVAAAVCLPTPDGFGYTACDSTAPPGPAFGFVDISATGTLVVEGDDTSSSSAPPSGLGVPIDLTVGNTRPGFRFYGTTYTEIVMASNGYLATDPADAGPDLSNDCPVPAVPSTPPNTTGARFYPLHDDLVMDSGTGGGYYQFFPSATAAGRAPDRGADVGVHVFQWHNAHHFGAVETFDFQALLYENGDVVYQYGPGNLEEGAGSTTGIQSPAPGDGGVPDFGLSYACNTAATIPNGLAVLILNPAGDVAIDKTADPVDPPAGATVTYTITATNTGVNLATDVMVTDVLPVGVTLTSSSASQGTYVNDVWSVGALDLGVAATLTIEAQVDFDQATNSIDNTAVLVTLGPDQTDGNPGNDSSTATVDVGFRVPVVGYGLDTDGDGYSDDFETLAGSDPNDMDDTPFAAGLIPGTPGPVELKRLKIKLNFRTAGKDKLLLKGTLPVADSAALAGLDVGFDLGGVLQVFTLDSKGKGANATGKLKVKKPKNASAKFTLKLKNESMQAALAANANLTNTTVKKEARTVRVSVVLPSGALQTDQPQTYTAKQDKKGKTK